MHDLLPQHFSAFYAQESLRGPVEQVDSAVFVDGHDQVMGSIQDGLLFVGQTHEGVEVGVSQITAGDHAYHLILVDYRQSSHTSLDQVAHFFIRAPGFHAGGHDLSHGSIGIPALGEHLVYVAFSQKPDHPALLVCYRGPINFVLDEYLAGLANRMGRGQKHRIGAHDVRKFHNYTPKNTVAKSAGPAPLLFPSITQAVPGPGDTCMSTGGFPLYSILLDAAAAYYPAHVNSRSVRR